MFEEVVWMLKSRGKVLDFILLLLGDFITKSYGWSPRNLSSSSIIRSHAFISTAPNYDGNSQLDQAHELGNPRCGREPCLALISFIGYWRNAPQPPSSNSGRGQSIKCQLSLGFFILSRYLTLSPFRCAPIEWLGTLHRMILAYAAECGILEVLCGVMTEPIIIVDPSLLTSKIEFNKMTSSRAIVRLLGSELYSKVLHTERIKI
jgi:hypothetical protein